MLEKIDKDLKKYYEKTLAENGVSAKGVGWKNEEAQYIRFAQLAKILSAEGSFSINDLGCGIGDFVAFLDKCCNGSYQYRGYDVLKEMVELAEKNYASSQNCQFKLITDASQMDEVEYTIASGIFNLRYGASDTEWTEYTLNTLQAMNLKSTKGFAFNALTKYSDPEYMQPHLFYSDPLFLFDYCKRNFAKDVALLHDYQQYDFTILVRKF